jgi:hypothetical protein
MHISNPMEDRPRLRVSQLNTDDFGHLQPHKLNNILVQEFDSEKNNRSYLPLHYKELSHYLFIAKNSMNNPIPRRVYIPTHLHI